MCPCRLRMSLDYNLGKDKLGRPQGIFLATRISGSQGKHLGKKMTSYFLKFGISSLKA